MRHVVLDLQGNQRESFDSQEELVIELQEGLREDAGLLRALYVLTYDEDGNQVGGSRRADEVLVAATSGGPRAWVFDFVNNTVFAVGAPESDLKYQEFVSQQRDQGLAIAGQSHR
jgi:hypothetical protein